MKPLKKNNNTTKTTVSLLIGYDFTNGKDKGVLLVGQKTRGESVEIINAFQGEEAEELYNKLITKKEKKDE